MFIELLDLLRCTNAHEDTWLVASFKTVSNRFVMEGTLGCPTCSAKYSITSGIADFRTATDSFEREPWLSLTTLEREHLATRAGISQPHRARGYGSDGWKLG